MKHEPDTPAQTAASPVTLTLRPAGPIVIEGPVVIRNNAGDVVEPPPSKVPGQIKLCGCGFSKNRPFCDGSHKR